VPKVIKTSVCFVFVTALTVLSASAAETGSGAGQPSTVAEARMMIEKTRQDIAQEEKLWADELAREKSAEVKRRQRYTEFNNDKQRLQAALADEEAKLKSLLSKMESHQGREKELALRFAGLTRAVGVEATRLHKAMAPGLPYRLDKRLETVDLLARDVESENISPEEALNRLWAVYQNERRLAQESELYSGEFDLGNGADPIQVKYLRLGRQVLAFSSLDGAKLGILVPKAGRYVWKRENDMDFASRQALKQAIATAEGKSVPGFVAVPIWKMAFAPALNTALTNNGGAK
jgi:hypothetical protein